MNAEKEMRVPDRREEALPREQPKKPYVAPELTVHGSVEKTTLAVLRW
jgi:hypothetical protein